MASSSWQQNLWTDQRFVERWILANQHRIRIDIENSLTLRYIAVVYENYTDQTTYERFIVSCSKISGLAYDTRSLTFLHYILTKFPQRAIFIHILQTVYVTVMGYWLQNWSKNGNMVADTDAFANNKMALFCMIMIF